jgi:hypothetical protein
MTKKSNHKPMLKKQGFRAIVNKMALGQLFIKKV